MADTAQLDLRMSDVRRLNSLGEQANRMLKLQEEQGELAGAIRAYTNMHHIAEEAIDVLLMLVSIHADFSTSDDLNIKPHGMPEWVDPILGMADMFLCQSEAIGMVAEFNQKLSGVRSSLYKSSNVEGMTAEEFRLAQLEIAARASVSIMLLAQKNVPEIDLQAIYNLKMEKWERVA